MPPTHLDEIDHMTLTKLALRYRENTRRQSQWLIKIRIIPGDRWKGDCNRDIYVTLAIGVVSFDPFEVYGALLSFDLAAERTISPVNICWLSFTSHQGKVAGSPAKFTSLSLSICCAYKLQLIKELQNRDCYTQYSDQIYQINFVLRTSCISRGVKMYCAKKYV